MVIPTIRFIAQWSILYNCLISFLKNPFLCFFFIFSSYLLIYS